MRSNASNAPGRSPSAASDLSEREDEIRLIRVAFEHLRETRGRRLVATRRELDRGEATQRSDVVGIRLDDPREGLDRAFEVPRVELRLTETLQDSVVIGMALEHFAIDRDLPVAISPFTLDLCEAHVEQEVVGEIFEAAPDDGLGGVEVLALLVDRGESERSA